MHTPHWSPVRLYTLSLYSSRYPWKQRSCVICIITSCRNEILHNASEPIMPPVIPIITSLMAVCQGKFPNYQKIITNLTISLRRVPGLSMTFVHLSIKKFFTKLVFFYFPSPSQLSAVCHRLFRPNRSE